MAATAPRVTPQQIAAMARARGYDPQAVLAVSGQEGLGGGIGDGGHAYGPFQLNNAGGAISQQYGGRVNDPSVQNWAWSPQGVSYALDRMGAAKGLRGGAAVRAIVNQFERPANPQGEIARALSGLGGAGAAGASPVAPAATEAPGPGTPPQTPNPTPSLLGALSGAGQDNYASFYKQLGSALRAQNQPGPVQPNVAPAPVATALAGTPPSGGKSIGYLEKFANPYGLTVTSTTGGQHAQNSYHYQGRAVDFGGQPQNMAKLAQTALAHPQDFVEVIYTGPGNTGQSILGGKVVPNSSLGKSLYAEHTNHVHLAR